MHQTVELGHGTQCTEATDNERKWPLFGGRCRRRRVTLLLPPYKETLCISAEQFQDLTDIFLSKISVVHRSIVAVVVNVAGTIAGRIEE